MTLWKSLYGLKQAPRAWFQRFVGYVTRVGFYHSRCDSSLFILRQGSQVAYLLIYMDDIILTASSTYLLQQVITSLHNEFNMTDLGALNYFLGIFATRHSTGLFLSQKQYAIELLARAHMTNCNLQELQLIRTPNWVLKICLYMHNPREPHLAALKRILRYIRGTLDFRFHLYSSTTISLVGYTDADWTTCPSTRRSTSGYCVFLGDNLLSWSSKPQQTISRSSADAEYRDVANVVAETAWLRNLLRELHSSLGEDIRKSFMDHLFNDFKQKGIYAFRDDNELPKGEEISPHLYEAIEESRFLIVIFSKDYASSSWCLKELVKILECKEMGKPKHEVQIIFYDAKPDVVRKQTGSYAEAFAKHELSNSTTVDKWKEALSMAANLSGWDLRT
uniref:ADP-ribosyl cyclase/cyclic ADP-ribose hydrolase n=1 Tax=Tanacetum cinerariifolium TaxID=118510 RepID=A0A699HQZ9_TANCI|nr:retrotransposon protein, putative, unclassified [Tanacetum cinerariifolium]